MESQEIKSLEYFLSEKGPYVVVVFIGSLVKANIPILERSFSEVSSRSATWVAVMFRDVKDIDLPSAAALVRAQKALRDAGKKLRLVSLRPDLRRMLEQRGSLRRNELANNLAEALESFRTT